MNHCHPHHSLRQYHCNSTVFASYSAVLVQQAVCEVLASLCAVTQQCLPCREASTAKLVEVAADQGKPVVLRFNDDSTEQLGVCMDMGQAVSKLREAAGCGKATPYFTASRHGASASSCMCTVSGRLALAVTHITCKSEALDLVQQACIQSLRFC